MTEADILTRSRDLAQLFGPLSLDERLAAIDSEIDGPIVFTTSFGLEDQVLTHALQARRSRILLVTLDTGRLFPETYDVWHATEQAYGVRVAGLVPDREMIEGFIAREGINGFRRSVASRRACCTIRKVAPLARALAGAVAWVTGLRRNQSDARADVSLVESDATYGVIKVNPLIDWSRADVENYIRTFDVPYNALHDRGFPSIGCEPCTRAVRPGEGERAGRWWWEQDEKKECGLHLRPRSENDEAARKDVEFVP